MVKTGEIRENSNIYNHLLSNPVHNFIIKNFLKIKFNIYREYYKDIMKLFCLV